MLVSRASNQGSGKLLYTWTVLRIRGSGASADPHGACSVEIRAPPGGSGSARRRGSESRKRRLRIRRSPNMYIIKALCPVNSSMASQSHLREPPKSDQEKLEDILRLIQQRGFTSALQLEQRREWICRTISCAREVSASGRIFLSAVTTR